jgi:cell division protein FtsB
MPADSSYWPLIYAEFEHFQAYQIKRNLSRPNASTILIEMRRFEPSFFVNVIGAVIALAILIRVIQTVSLNYSLQKQIDTQRQQISLLEQKNQELRYNIAYYKTNSFTEREARAHLGLQQPGENVIIFPSTSPTPSPDVAAAKAKAKRSNLRQWIDFLSGKEV